MDAQLVISALAFVISLGSLCALALHLMREHGDADVGELAQHVAQLRKAYRADQMRRVRQEAGAADGGAGDVKPPAELRAPGLGSPTRQETKAEIRARLMGGQIDPMSRH